MCARLLSNLSFLYIGRVHGAISGCTVLGEVHPVSAQNKSLISDTGPVVTICHSEMAEKSVRLCIHSGTIVLKCGGTGFAT